MATNEREIIGPHPALMASLLVKNPIVYLGIAFMVVRMLFPGISGYVPLTLPWWVPSIETIGLLLTFGGIVWVVLVYQATSYYSDGENLYAEDGVIVRKNNMIPSKMIFDSDLRRGILERVCGCGTIIFKLADGEIVQLVFVLDPETVRQQAMSKSRTVGVV